MEALLLPENVYPETLDDQGRRELDETLRARLDDVPRAPGHYLDRDGDQWWLGEDGTWSDTTTVTVPPIYGPVMVTRLPLTTATL